jgi:hypothetical protein
MPNKKTIYILLVMFLGLLLAEIVHWLIEIWLVNKLMNAGLAPQAHIFLGTVCYLPPYLQFGLLLFGLAGGYFLGQTWWRIVYVEHRHWSYNSTAE